MSKTLYLSIALIACCSFTGCTGVKNSMRLSEKNSQWNPLSKLTETRKNKDFMAKYSKEEPVPETMAVIWKDTLLEKPGTPPVRGFGGRVYFYDKNSNAVKADGEMIVYGFDDSNKDNGQGPQADRKYVFNAEQFQSHYSETDLGPSYSVWVPWEKVGGFRKTITLIPVFKTVDGQVLHSDQSINVLPGKNPFQSGSATAKGKTISKVTQVGFDANGENGEVAQADLEQDEETYNRPRIRTSTISLTPHLATHFSQPVAKPESSAKVDANSGLSAAATETKTESRERFNSSRVRRDDSSGTEDKSGADENSGSSTKQRPWAFGAPGKFR